MSTAWLKNKEAESKAIVHAASKQDKPTSNDATTTAEALAAVIKAGQQQQTAAATTTNADRSALTYYLTLFRGSLVVAQLVDGSCVEGLMHTVEFGGSGGAVSPSASPSSAALVLQMAQRQPDAFAAANVASPRAYEARPGEASLARNTSYPFEGQRKIPLTDLVQATASGVDVALWTQQYADYVAKHGLARGGVGANSVSGGARGFATDSAIGGGVDHERELVPWQPEGAAAAGGESLESAATAWGRGGGGGGGQFNQFETFERMTGSKSTFKFDEYSTPLDRNSAFYKSNEARAQAIANSIFSSEATSAHQRLEREGAEDGPAFRDRDADEGDLFSDVRRESPPAATATTAPGSASKAGTYKPGAFARQKQAGGDAKKSPEAPVSQPGSAVKSPKPAHSPVSPAPVAIGATSAAAAAAAATPNGSAAPATAGEGVSPKPIDISLAAQQKVAEIAASPKEPAASAASSAAPATTNNNAAASANSSATAATTTSAPASTSDSAASSTASASTSSSTSSSMSTTAAAPIKSKLNAKAKEFKMSASAPAFTPSASPSIPAAAPVPPMVVGGGMPMAPMFGGPGMPLFPGGVPMGAGPMGAPFPLGVGGPQVPNPQQMALLQMRGAGMGPQPGQFFPQPTQQQMLQMQMQQQLQMQMAAAAAAGLGGGAMNFAPQPQMAFQQRGGPGQQQQQAQQQQQFNPQQMQMQMQMMQQGPFPPHFQPQQFGRQF